MANQNAPNKRKFTSELFFVESVSPWIDGIDINSAGIFNIIYY